MNNSRQLKIYKPNAGCPTCGSGMNRIDGINGWFFSCIKYPSCKGSRNSAEITFTVFNVGNTIVLNNSIINCTIDNHKHTKLNVVFQNGCFGVEIDGVFTLLKECRDIVVFNIK